MRLYEGARTKVAVGNDVRFLVQMGVHQGSALTAFLFANANVLET